MPNANEVSKEYRKPTRNWKGNDLNIENPFSRSRYNGRIFDDAGAGLASIFAQRESRNGRVRSTAVAEKKKPSLVGNTIVSRPASKGTVIFEVWSSRLV